MGALREAAGGQETYAKKAGEEYAAESNKPKTVDNASFMDSTIQDTMNSKQGQFAQSAYNLASKTIKGEDAMPDMGYAGKVNTGVTRGDIMDFGDKLGQLAGASGGSGGASHSKFEPVAAINTDTPISPSQRQQMRIAGSKTTPAQLRGFNDYLTEALQKRM